MIAFAKSFDSIEDVNGNSHTDCVSIPAQNGNPPPAPLTYKSITITSFDEGQTTFSCLNGGLSSNSGTLQTPLFDTNAVEAVTCSFTCSQLNLSSSPTINISLKLQRKQQNTNLLPEAQTVIDFQTSVTLRNN
jgi:hypothetical protein